MSEQEFTKRDKISHYLLRLLYSQKKEQRDWFVRQETKIFRNRLIEKKLTFEDAEKYYIYFKEQLEELNITIQKVQPKDVIALKKRKHTDDFCIDWNTFGMNYKKVIIVVF